MSLTYTGIRVTDLGRSIRFYVDGLGLVERRRGTMSHGGQWVALQDPESGVELELNHYAPGSRFAQPYLPGEGLDHLRFDVADARQMIDRLRAMGAKVALEPWMEEGKYWIGFVEDPDGLWIEIQSPIVGSPSPGTGGPRSRAPRGARSTRRSAGLEDLLHVGMLFGEDLAAAVVAADPEEVRVGGQRLPATDAAEHRPVRAARSLKPSPSPPGRPAPCE